MLKVGDKFEQDGTEYMAEFPRLVGRSMTDENVDAWAMIASVHQIQHLTDWANMLEARVKELDPMYRAYPWGRKATPNV